MHLLHALLAQGDPRELRYVYVWGGILIALTLFAFFAYATFKRWMNSSETSTSAGFSLSDLRKLRDEGKMSAEEYEKIRADMVAAARRMTGEMPDIIPRRPTPAPEPAPGDARPADSPEA